MVTTVSIYSCEVCGKPHRSLEAAAACEAQGVPVSHMAAGDFVTAGYGVYGWWGADRSWALTTDRNAEMDDHLGPGNNGKGRGYKPVWRQDPGDGFDCGPGRLWFREIWRVVGVDVATHEESSFMPGHRLRFTLWNPRHPNRVKGTEAIGRTYSSGHHTPVPLAPEFTPPDLTDAEAARFAALCALTPAERGKFSLL